MSQNGLFFSIFGPWLVRPFLRLLNWLGVGRPMLTCDTTDIFKVFVKISGGDFQQATIPLALHKSWTVKDVKHHLVFDFMDLFFFYLVSSIRYFLGIKTSKVD
jgi:hypothetical protein